jgi:pectin methylesterase-like acyl-CoA thioesterase
MFKHCLHILASIFFPACLVAQANLTVAADGSGDYKTVQAALNAIPEGNRNPIVIFIKQGTYKEKLHLDSARDFVTLLGEDKSKTVLTYDDHTGKISAGGDTVNTRTSYSFLIRGNHFRAENISFCNDAGFAAGQAVAVEVRGDQAVFVNCRFIGNQDVLFTNADDSRQYYRDCYIEGTTDFIFGSATAWFEHCHVHSKKNSHVTAASTPQSHPFGYVFHDCELTGDTSLHRVSLGRPWRPFASVTYIRCRLGSHILAAGWSNWNATENYKTARYAEYRNEGPGADPSGRVPWSRRLTDEEAKQYRVENIFGGWNPSPPRTAYRVLDWKADQSLHMALIGQMHAEYDRRRKIFSQALASRQSMLTYMKSVREKYIRLLGPFPGRVSLDAQTTGTIQQDGYRIEKIIYQSFLHHHVTSNFYVPQGKGPFPALLLFCGHEDAGKAATSCQQTAILCAQNGFAVLVIDPVSQGERYQLTDPAGKPVTRGGTTEHTLLNEASGLVGGSAVAYELWDNMRSMDYLLTRPEVDSGRIGCLGNSGGGMQTIYFAAMDARVKVIVPCSYLASRERMLELSGPSDGCSHLPDEGKWLLEMSDYLVACAPKPLLVLAGRYDFIDYRATLSAYKDLQRVYKVLGQPAKLALFACDDGHGISKPKREAAVCWFRKWLYRDPSPVREKPVPVLPEQALCCTRAGQVNKEFPDEVNIIERDIALGDSLETCRQAFARESRETAIPKILALLSIGNEDRMIDAEPKGPIGEGPCRFQAFIVRKRGEIPLPVLLAYPYAAARGVIIWFYGPGKDKIADSASLMQDYRQQGYAVVLCDARGMGETADNAEFNDPKYYNKEYRNALLALHIGRPIVGQRVEDILTVFDFIAADDQLRDLPVEVNASGAMTVPALHAAVLTGKMAQLNLYNGIRSFKEILQNPVERDWYSDVLPGVMHWYDLPDLVKRADPLKIRFMDGFEKP